MFLPPFTILPFTTGDAVVAGRSRGYLGRQGTPIGPHDVQIAAQGLSQGLTVVTHNHGCLQPGVRPHAGGLGGVG